MRLVVKSYFPRAEVMRSYCRYLSAHSCINYFNKTLRYYRSNHIWRRHLIQHGKSRHRGDEKAGQLPLSCSVWYINPHSETEAQLWCQPSNEYSSMSCCDWSILALSTTWLVQPVGGVVLGAYFIENFNLSGLDFISSYKVQVLTESQWAEFVIWDLVAHTHIQPSFLCCHCPILWVMPLIWKSVLYVFLIVTG